MMRTRKSCLVLTWLASSRLVSRASMASVSVGATGSCVVYASEVMVFTPFLLVQDAI